MKQLFGFAIALIVLGAIFIGFSPDGAPALPLTESRYALAFNVWGGALAALITLLTARAHGAQRKGQSLMSTLFQQNPAGRTVPTRESLPILVATFGVVSLGFGFDPLLTGVGFLMLTPLAWAFTPSLIRQTSQIAVSLRSKMDGYGVHEAVLLNAVCIPCIIAAAALIWS